MSGFESIEQSLHFINKQAEKYAQAKSERVYLEEFRKSLKAKLMNEAEREGRKTGQEREAYAYADQRYVDLLLGLKAAVEVEEALRWKLVSAKENINMRHQQNMMKMAEMKMR